MSDIMTFINENSFATPIAGLLEDDDQLLLHFEKTCGPKLRESIISALQNFLVRHPDFTFTKKVD
jgi:hypothetical protein